MILADWRFWLIRRLRIHHSKQVLWVPGMYSKPDSHDPKSKPWDFWYRTQGVIPSSFIHSALTEFSAVPLGIEHMGWSNPIQHYPASANGCEQAACPANHLLVSPWYAAGCHCTPGRNHDDTMMEWWSPFEAMNNQKDEIEKFIYNHLYNVI